MPSTHLHRPTPPRRRRRRQPRPPRAEPPVHVGRRRAPGPQARAVAHRRGQAPRLQRLPRPDRPAHRQRRLRSPRRPARCRPAGSSTSPTGSSSCAPRPSRRPSTSTPSPPATWSAPRPLVSAAFHDEPAVEEMNALGLDITSVGNHEFDEGVDELLRLQNGGCHPTDGCQDGDGFAGADYPMLAANVVKKSNGKPILPAYKVQEGRRRRRRLRRHDPRGHAEHREPDRHHLGRTSSTRSRPPTSTPTSSRPRASTRWCCCCTRAASRRLRTTPRAPAPASAARSRTSWPASTRRTGSWSAVTPTSPTSATCPTAPASRRSSPAPRRPAAWSPTSPSPSTRPPASSPRPRRVNELVKNGVSDGDGAWLKDAAGNFVRNPDWIDPMAKLIADKYRTAVAPIANAIVGSITADITRTRHPGRRDPARRRDRRRDDGLLDLGRRPTSRS